MEIEDTVCLPLCCPGLPLRLLGPLNCEGHRLLDLTRVLPPLLHIPGPLRPPLQLPAPSRGREDLQLGGLGGGGLWLKDQHLY